MIDMSSVAFRIKNFICTVIVMLLLVTSIAGCSFAGEAAATDDEAGQDETYEADMVSKSAAKKILKNVRKVNSPLNGGCVEIYDELGRAVYIMDGLAVYHSSDGDSIYSADNNFYMASDETVVPIVRSGELSILPYNYYVLMTKIEDCRVEARINQNEYGKNIELVMSVPVSSLHKLKDSVGVPGISDSMLGYFEDYGGEPEYKIGCDIDPYTYRLRSIKSVLGNQDTGRVYSFGLSGKVCFRKHMPCFIKRRLDEYTALQKKTEDVHIVTCVVDPNLPSECAYEFKLPNGNSEIEFDNSFGAEYKLYADSNCTYEAQRPDAYNDSIFYVRRQSDYSKKNMWVYRPCENEIEYDTDVFFLSPTSIGRDAYHNLMMDDEDGRSDFENCVNIEKGIYDDEANFFAPYYRQMCLGGYDIEKSNEEREGYLGLGYEDVRNAFHYYLGHYNNDRKIILAGFSQGTDMILRLLHDDLEMFEDRLVAVYAIGWNITDEYLENNPSVRMAQGEEDTGVVVAFCSEAEWINESVIVPVSTNGINPLNWKTDSTKAEPEENMGSVFNEYLDDEGNPISEDELCGAYLDEKRGTLKVIDLREPERFKDPELFFLESGNYHKYDHEFFYRNLEDNVKKRIAAYNNR